MNRSKLRIPCLFIYLVATGCGPAGSQPATPGQGASSASPPPSAGPPPSPGQPPTPAAALKAPSDSELAELTHEFESAGYTGCFALRAPGQLDALVHPEQCRTGFLPASTFKIPNSLFALELGVVSGPDHLFKWDGTDRGIAAWNRDHTLLSAIQYSAVWYYQRVAREIGQERMQAAVSSIHYGNEKISPVVDEFWLNGDMRVTAVQQLDLLQQLYAEALPLSKQTQRTVKGMLRSIDYPELPIYAKTGRTRQAGVGDVGWYVGYVDQPEGPHYFATLLTRSTPPTGADSFSDDRKRVTLQLLRKAGALRDTAD